MFIVNWIGDMSNIISTHSNFQNHNFFLFKIQSYASTMLAFKFFKFSHTCNTNMRLGLWYLTPLPTIYQLYRGGQFYWSRKPEYQEKTTDLSQVTVRQTLSHNVVSSRSRQSRIRTRIVSGDRHRLHS